MNRFYKWCLRKYLQTTKVKRDDVIIIALKEEGTRKDLEEMAEMLNEYIPKSVLIAGVDQIIVA